MVVSSNGRIESATARETARRVHDHVATVKMRGTCSNKLMLREDVARRSILGAVREALFTPAAVTFLRKRIAERLRIRAQTAETDLQERLDRLRRTEDRIHGLVRFIAEGDESKYVRETLRGLEAQAKIDTAAVEDLKRELKSPLRLPTPEALVERAQDLEKVFAAEQVRAREALRGVFENVRSAQSIHRSECMNDVDDFVTSALEASKLPRDVLVERGIARGHKREALEVAVTVTVMDEILEESARRRVSGPRQRVGAKLRGSCCSWLRSPRRWTRTWPP